MLFIKAEYEEEHVHRKILCKCQWPPGICPVGCWPCGSEQAPQWSGGGSIWKPLEWRRCLGRGEKSTEELGPAAEGHLC